jgi:hypothetical protein
MRLHKLLGAVLIAGALALVPTAASLVQPTHTSTAAAADSFPCLKRTVCVPVRNFS